MYVRRSPSLPRPRAAEVMPDPADRQNVEQTIRDLRIQRGKMIQELGLVDARLEFVLRSLCGDDDNQDVEKYRGDLGVSRAFVDAYEPPVGQLQWLKNIDTQFSGLDEDPGNVNGERWATGALIGEDLFLTAGHCFDPYPRGWVVPSRGSVPISPGEIAKQMCVNFNYQVDGTSKTGEMRPGEPFPVLGLLEHWEGGVDYAIVKLGRNAANEMPSSRFGALVLASKDVTTPGAVLCVIQHPNRQGKMIEAGTLLESQGGFMAYSDIDTNGGSSGAPVLSDTGEVVGIHMCGGCSTSANYGVTIGAIRGVSRLIP